MMHKVGKQGLVVPFGYVTAKGRPLPYQQGQFIPPDTEIVEVLGDNENDPTRNTETLMRLCGVAREAKPRD